MLWGVSWSPKPIRRNKLLEFFASLPRCLVGLEASGSAHHWARELIQEPRAVRGHFLVEQRGFEPLTSAVCRTRALDR